MFESLKGKFRNLFKKDHADPEKEKGGDSPDAGPKEGPKAKPPKEEKKKVFDDDWDDDWDEDELNDLIPEDEWVDDVDEDDDASADGIPDEPVIKKKAVSAPNTPPARTVPAPATKTVPVPPPVPVPPVTAAPEKDDQRLSRKERTKLAKQEKIAAKKAAKEKKHDDKVKGRTEEDVVGDRGKRIKERGLDDVLWELEIALMEADVAYPVVEEIKNDVKEGLLGKRHVRSHSLDEVVEISIRESVSKILKINEFDFDAWFDTRNKPVVVMFVGINGTGKTTAIAKVANRLMRNERTVVLAAADTFRAGAIEQLTIHSERLGCKIVKHSPDSDPAAVAFDAIDHAKAKRKDAVLVDTAGRMQTNSNLMDEMKKIKRVAKPDLVMFVGDSLAGNDAVEQARAFDAAVGVDAIMLTKIDADSKGGAALSMAYTIGKPIAFVSNGQGYEDLIKFSSKWMTDRLFED
jgi:fused signal recognition particle receptor